MKDSRHFQGVLSFPLASYDDFPHHLSWPSHVQNFPLHLRLHRPGLGHKERACPLQIYLISSSASQPMKSSVLPGLALILLLASIPLSFIFFPAGSALPTRCQWLSRPMHSRFLFSLFAYFLFSSGTDDLLSINTPTPLFPRMSFLAFSGFGLRNC